ncbi:MAG: FAD-binding oxidoreductase [Arcticibacter sp.]
MRKGHVLVSFDKNERTSCFSIRPEKYDDIFALKNQAIIARGAGLSYCNAGVADDALVVDMTRMNRILCFDPNLKLVTVESGIRVGDLHNFLISKGFIMPVLPGYPTITIGGCIGFNIHGKSEYKVGTFGDWVESMVLFHPTHGEIEVSRNNNFEIFNLTVGGMGFTGIVISCTLRIQSVLGSKLLVERSKVRNIFESVEVMLKASSEYEFVYSWNNFNKYGSSFGRGFVYKESYQLGESKTTSFDDRMALSYRLPGFHQPFMIRMINGFYELLNVLKSEKYTVPLSGGSFPIYGKEIYFDFFGRKGFREYQVLFPWENWENACKELESLLKTNQYPIALGSLKVFKGKRHNISFSGEGLCLTLDTPSSSDSIALFEKLDSWCIKHNGIPNLSKDSRLSKETISSCYSGFSAFRKAVLEFDPNNLIKSELKARLGFYER